MSAQKLPVDITYWGAHAVQESLASRFARVHEIWTLPAQEKEFAAHRGATKVHVVNRDALDRKLGTDKHQGVGARATLEIDGDVGSWIDNFPAAPGAVRRLLVLDQIEDPQNLGALYRSAHFFGFGAVLVTKDHCAPINGAVCKASAGAIFSLPTIRCANLSRELSACQDLGFWCVGLDAAGERRLDAFAHRGSLALVIGNEGHGMRKLTREKCDELLSISSLSGRDSLNASVAAAVAMYEVTKSPVIP